MTDTPTILPPNATDFELAVEQAGARATRLPTPIRDVRDPAAIPAAALPFLAWERSVDIWDRNWPDDKKRIATERSIAMHRLKGTLAGIRAHLDLEGVAVVRAITPPQKVFSGASLTRAEREAWLEALPQVRVWRFNEPGSAGLGVFMGGKLSRPIMGTRFFKPSTATSRLRRRARWIVDGVETDTAVTEFGSWFQLHLTAKAGTKVFSSSRPRRRFFQPSTATTRLVTIEPVSLSPWRTVIGPRISPVTSEPELVAEPGQARKAVFSGRRCRSGFFLPSTAKYRLFERYAVTTGARQAARKRRPAVQFMGVGRYGMAPHTAEIKIRIRGKRHRFAAGEGIVYPRARFWMPRDTTGLDRALAAIRASKRLSDRVKVDTKTSFQFIAGRLALAGDRIVI